MQMLSSLLVLTKKNFSHGNSRSNFKKRNQKFGGAEFEQILEAVNDEGDRQIISWLQLLQPHWLVKGGVRATSHTSQEP